MVKSSSRILVINDEHLVLRELPLVPGQLITKKIVDYLGHLLHSHKRMEMHGVVHEGYLPCIRVLKPEEEKSLHRLS